MLKRSSKQYSFDCFFEGDNRLRLAHMERDAIPESRSSRFESAVAVRLSPRLWNSKKLLRCGSSYSFGVVYV